MTRTGSREKRMAEELMKKHICDECGSIADDAHVFEMAWTCYEDYEPHLFIGSASKTQADWEKDCERAIRECGEDYLVQETSWAGANRWMAFACKKLEEYGYKRVRPTVWSFFGGSISRGEDDEDKKWRKIVGKDLMRKAIKKNKEVGS